jgi:hypothetical protein
MNSLSVTLVAPLDVWSASSFAARRAARASGWGPALAPSLST